MATPKITDVVNGQGYKADGVQFSLNPTTGRYQEDFGAKIPKEDLASFQKANPGLTFDAQDYAAYNDPNSYVYRMPSEVSPKMDFNSFTKPQVQGSMASPYIPTADMSPVALATAGTAEQVVRDQQAQAGNTQAAQTEQAIADYVKKYLGLTGETGIAEQKAQDTSKLTQEADISGTTSKLKDLSTKMDALSIQTEAEKQAILASPIGGITSADLSGREQEITRKNNISRLNLAAESLVLQGKLDSAKEAIKNAIDLKYAPQEARYKSILEFNTINEKILGKEAEKQKDLANAKIKDLEEKKKNDNEIATMIAEAVPNAPASIIANAKAVQAKGGTALEVATALGQYGGDYLQNLKLKADIERINAEIRKTDADARKIRGETGGVTSDGVSTISPTAQNYVDLINKGTLSLEEALTKIGTSKAGLALKNEIIAGVKSQGGRTDTAYNQLQKTKDLVDKILTGDTEYYGTSMAPRGRINPYYQSFQADVDQLTALLTGDNLGLLKGPMSDKDIEFIKNMSSGLENITISETSAKEKLAEIKGRLDEKLKDRPKTKTQSYTSGVKQSLQSTVSSPAQQGGYIDNKK